MKSAQYHYPVYAMGYNWLRCNSEAAERLAKRIDAWIAEWKARPGYQCDQVILISHSMGGLVCRAYAKQHPDKVLGVIHGVQPAVGAPLAYRRMACGTETGDANGDNVSAKGFATIAGKTPAETIPVMGVSPGPLELLPCHLHPSGWLKGMVTGRNIPAPKEMLALPKRDPYDEIYRDMDSWYRLIDPALIDPGERYRGKKGGALKAVEEAINKAERFHKEILGDYYPPNTYAFYGRDANYLSYGTVRWAGSWHEADPIDEAKLRKGKPASSNIPGRVLADFGPPGPIATQVRRDADAILRAGGADPLPRPNPSIEFQVQVQDAPGDGTVNWQSGAAPAKGVKRLFCTTGYDHQGAYKDEQMRLLTFHLICKIAQDAP